MKPGYTLVTGDCIDAMRAMEAESVDAVVTDPPYGLSFMSKEWDLGVPPVAVWQEVFRVLRPGGRLLCFAGTRTLHRMWCNIEDAGFTIEDTIAWMYGSGFPKHRSKLKPAYEPICVARKGPVSELNIDACRIGTGDVVSLRPVARRDGKVYGEMHGADPETNTGRWPANVMLDEDAARLRDEQAGLRDGQIGGNNDPNGSMGYHGGAAGRSAPGVNDFGGTSRFFYVSKASRAERNAGLEGQPRRSGGSNAKGFTADVEAGQDRNRPVENHHPTVKPVDLMRHLVRLVTPTDGVVLDPFMGSGTTGVACIEEGREFIGCELSPEYVEIARRRIEHAIACHQPTLFDPQGAA